jgi:formylglycine-generating enzyme required for sulfatase activity
MSEHIQIAQHLQELEAYLNTLTDALQRGELPVNLKRVRPIFDAIILENLPRLDLPADKLIDLYNDIPSILAAYAIEANITSNSFLRQDPSQIIFGRELSGNYWIVPMQTAREYAWLLPNPQRKIAIERLPSLAMAFDFDRTHLATDLSLMGINKPALLKLLPTTPITWQTIQRGQLGTIRSTTEQNDYSFLQPTLPMEVRKLGQEWEKMQEGLHEFGWSIDAKLEEFASKLKDLQAAVSTDILVARIAEKLESNYHYKIAEQATSISAMAAELAELRQHLKLDRTVPPVSTVIRQNQIRQDQTGQVILPTNPSLNSLARLAYACDLGHNIQLEMVYIDRGQFAMGSPTNEECSSATERPQHLVSIPPFYLSKYPITQEQYLAIMGKNPSLHPGAALPVEQVTWQAARQFCQKLAAKTGDIYRLPSEAEWEYACRAGTNTAFFFGDGLSAEMANYRAQGWKTEQSTPTTPKKKKAAMLQEGPTVVGLFPPNAFGLYDMHGNVWEWCEDGWHDNYEGAPMDGTAWANHETDKRLLRGGSWDNYSRSCRSALRFKWSADSSNPYIGFRIACTPQRPR